MSARITYYGNIVTNGLALFVDAAKKDSYSGTGTIWRDLSYNRYSGTLINGPIFNSNDGGSIVFDGTNDSSSFGNILNLRTSSCTINQWIYINSSASLSSTLSKTIFDVQNYRYAILVDTLSRVGFFIQGNGGADVNPYTTLSLTNGVWYMITFLVDRASAIKIYVNGVDQTLTTTATISQWNGLDFLSTNNFRIGSYQEADNVTPNLVFNGRISMTQMYFRLLSDQEILQNYNATKSRYGL
jgi:hypothetical protein